MFVDSKGVRGLFRSVLTGADVRHAKPDPEIFRRALEVVGALPQHVVFIDDTFNVPLPRFKDICRMMIKNDYQFNWFSYFRCSNSDEEAIDLMAQSGCKGVFLGIESGSPAILKNMTKAATPEKYVEGMKLLHQHNIMTFGSFIIGFPGETDETVNKKTKTAILPLIDSFVKRSPSSSTSVIGGAGAPGWMMSAATGAEAAG